MRFTLKNSPDVMGHKIEVLVVAGEGEAIARVVTTFENSDLANDSLSPLQVQYERVFRKVGGITPGANHTVLITAENDKGDSQSASRTWTD